MQATVASFEPASRCGTVLRDNGIELSFDAAAFAAGGLLRLRIGQRVAMTIVGGRISALTIATFPLP